MAQMTPEVSKLLEQALSLSVEEQEALADSLISNLGGKVDEGVQAAWEAEIGKRVAELDSGRRRLLHGRKCADAISRSFPMLTDSAEFHDEAAAEYDAALTGTVSAAQMPHLNLTLKWALAYIIEAPRRWAIGPHSTLGSCSDNFLLF